MGEATARESVVLVIDEHRGYLADAARVSAYASAIAAVVKPGDVVLDLASGTGILGLLACRAGAARVYAIDGGGMSGPARAIVRANGLEDRVHVIDGFSTRVELPERADVLVTDQIGYFGVEGGIVEFVADARRRLLKPEARLVPSRIDLLVAPVEAPDVAGAIDFWSRRPAGFDMAAIGDLAANSGHPRTLDTAQLLGAPAVGGSIDLGADDPSIVVSAEIAVTRPGTLHGVGGWFTATLSPAVEMSNVPDSPNRIARRGVVFPVRPAAAVAAGDRVSVRMRMLPAQLVTSWTVRVFRGDATEPSDRFDHSTLGGMLLDTQRLRRTGPEFVPNLTERGKARLSVLDLCDGRRPVAAIERDVLDRHPGLFRNRAEAAVFVAEVVAGDSE
jgi:hypothetical protein